MNQATDPRLPEGYYVRAWNVSSRGGVLRTRPGTQFLFNLPEGKVQGMCQFDPIYGTPGLLIAVDGYVYHTEYPFRRMRRIPGFRFNPNAETVHFVNTIRFVERNDDGSIRVIRPKKVVVMQDGVSPPAYFDGYDSGFIRGEDVTPQGTVMAWSGNRLWVARRNRVFASDYGNPFSFVEQFYLGESDSFLMPEPVTAFAEVPGIGNTPALLVFSKTQTVALQSGIFDREQWPTTKDFQVTVFPDVGCVSQRSVVQQYGYLWWHAIRGQVSIDLASQANVSSALPLADNELSFWKGYVTPGTNRVAAAAFENLLLVSAPYGSLQNTHTWVLDNSVVQTIRGGLPPAWVSTWTGFFPVEWAKLTIFGGERLYVVSHSPEGESQLLEVFSGHRTDTGQDIECAAELRSQTAGTPVVKGFKFAEMAFSDVLGDVDFRVDWRGYSRGAYKQCMGGRALAGRGSFRAGEDVEASSVVQAFIGQMRRLKTQDTTATKEIALSTCHTEVGLREQWDWGFSFLVRWSGHAALREFEATYESTQVSRLTGECWSGDEAVAFTRWDGSSASGSPDGLLANYPVFDASQTVNYTFAEGTEDEQEFSATRSAQSLISQAAADKLALQKAQAQVARSLELNTLTGSTGSGSPVSQVEPVSADPVGDTYSSVQYVSLSTPTVGASIWFTLDGSAPSPNNGTLYSDPIEIADTTLLRAAAYADGYNPSEELIETYGICIPLEQVETPEFDPEGGEVSEETEVTITCATAGADIYYTTDGSEPTTSSTLYFTPVVLTETTILRAVAVKAGMLDSKQNAAAYVFDSGGGGPANASIIVGNPADNNALKFTAVAAGAAGNGQRLVIVPTDSGALYLPDMTGGPVWISVADQIVYVIVNVVESGRLGLRFGPSDNPITIRLIEWFEMLSNPQPAAFAYMRIEMRHTTTPDLPLAILNDPTSAGPPDLIVQLGTDGSGSLDASKNTYDAIASLLSPLNWLLTVGADSGGYIESATPLQHVRFMPYDSAEYRVDGFTSAFVTATQVKAAFDASAEATTVLTCEHYGGSDGSGVFPVSVLSAQGGVD